MTLGGEGLVIALGLLKELATVSRRMRTMIPLSIVEIVPSVGGVLLLELRRP
jgi:hypothetical protein